MNSRLRSFTGKKKNMVKKVNQKKIQYENYDISKGINLKIINAVVEKAKVDIHGNYIYKVHTINYYID